MQYEPVHVLSLAVKHGSQYILTVSSQYNYYLDRSYPAVYNVLLQVCVYNMNTECVWHEYIFTLHIKLLSAAYKL